MNTSEAEVFTREAHNKKVGSDVGLGATISGLEN